MIIILFFLFLLFYTFVCYIKKKYSNPYTLTYIFGLKGSGKSTFMVKMMLNDLRRGWNVYTNMTDVVIPGVNIIDSRDLVDHVPPPKSSLYIDEAGLLWDNRKFASFQTGYVEYFKLQRKYHNKVVINSQALDVDKKIRDLVDRMYLMTNIWGCIGVARPLKRTIKVLEAQGNSESRLAMNLTFEGLLSFVFFWLPFYWSYFDSFKAPVRPPIPSMIVSGNPPSRFSFRVLLSRLNHSFNRR